jgi:hypothetical protein
MNTATLHKDPKYIDFILNKISDEEFDKLQHDGIGIEDLHRLLINMFIIDILFQSEDEV